MPVHDWTQVDAGIFHAFHHSWIEELARALNRGLLPADYFALPEQNISRAIPDVLTLELGTVKEPPSACGGIAVAVHRPRTRLTARAEANVYTMNASRLIVRPL